MQYILIIFHHLDAQALLSSNPMNSFGIISAHEHENTPQDLSSCIIGNSGPGWTILRTANDESVPPGNLYYWLQVIFPTDMKIIRLDRQIAAHNEEGIFWIQYGRDEDNLNFIMESDGSTFKVSVIHNISYTFIVKK